MIDLPELLILDIGHGNCAILRDTLAVTVIDCGYDGVTLIETLERLGINAVDNVIISHADIDHIGGLVPLVHQHCLCCRHDEEILKYALQYPDDVAKDFLNQLHQYLLVTKLLGKSREANQPQQT